MVQALFSPTVVIGRNRVCTHLLCSKETKWQCTNWRRSTRKYKVSCTLALGPVIAQNSTLDASAVEAAQQSNSTASSPFPILPTGDNANCAGEATPSTASKRSTWNKGLTTRQEVREKISASMEKRWKNPAHRHAVVSSLKGKEAWNKGRVMSEGMRAKVRQSRLGTHHSSETRRKMSESHKGTTVATSTREKLSRSLAGRQLSAETRLRIAASQQRRWQEKKRQRESAQVAAAATATAAMAAPAADKSTSIPSRMLRDPSSTASSFPSAQTSSFSSSSSPAAPVMLREAPPSHASGGRPLDEEPAWRGSPPGSMAWGQLAPHTLLPAWASWRLTAPTRPPPPGGHDPGLLPQGDMRPPDGRGHDAAHASDRLHRAAGRWPPDGDEERRAGGGIEGRWPPLHPLDQSHGEAGHEATNVGRVRHGPAHTDTNVSPSYNASEADPQAPGEGTLGGGWGVETGLSRGAGGRESAHDTALSSAGVRVDNHGHASSSKDMDSVFNLSPRSINRHLASSSVDPSQRIPNANAPYIDQLGASGSSSSSRRRGKSSSSSSSSSPTGRHRSEATRRKISAAMVGRRHSEATRAKISAAMREHQRVARLRRLLREEKSRNERPPSEQIASYKHNLRRYNTLREELQNWSDAFRAHNGRRPTMVDVERTSIPWLVTQFREYIKLRDLLMRDTRGIRTKLSKLAQQDEPDEPAGGSKRGASTRSQRPGGTGPSWGGSLMYFDSQEDEGDVRYGNL